MTGLTGFWCAGPCYSQPGRCDPTFGDSTFFPRGTALAVDTCTMSQQSDSYFLHGSWRPTTYSGNLTIWIHADDCHRFAKYTFVFYGIQSGACLYSNDPRLPVTVTINVRQLDARVDSFSHPPFGVRAEH